QVAEARPNPLGALLRIVLRLALLCLIAIAALTAAALFLTPTRQSVLIMGSDARPDELQRGEVGRTDTLQLLVADRATPRLATLSVPRDLWVNIPGFGAERINAAYEFGGSETAKQTVSNVLGQPVDRYVLIGLQGVRDVVDAVGGVDITVPQAIHDDAYPTDDYGYKTVDIPAGRQHMDGETALEYARTRHQDNDFARAGRQQQVMAAVRNALFNPLNWPRAPAVFVAVQRSVKTDVGPLDAIAIAAAFVRSPGDPDHMVIDTSLAAETTGEGDAYLLTPTPELKPAVARFLAGPSAASVDVLNGAGVAGLAARTADRLTQNGFIVNSVGDAAQRQSQTTIYSTPAARPAAERLASLLGLPASRITATAPAGQADIRLILGSDAH
ncbi:MAG: LCP family protein, partial [Chloroflexi bacterium]|nr:LCP family protein [Chloroflexota bacterium]